jgi:adenosylcobinamide-GDP ribazoletransferase
MPVGLGGAGAAAIWFPVVGALVGAAAGSARAASVSLLGGMAASVLAVGILVGLTGALHQDGLADTADGLGARGDRDRRLAAMRDPAIGAFGVLALIGWGLLMVAALAPLDAGHGLRSLTAAAVAGRWIALLHARVLPSARADGLGAGFVPSGAALIVASLAALGGVLAICGPAAGGGALLAAVAACAALSWWMGRALGGCTGDTLGATIALAEAAVCTTLLGFWR